MLPLSSYRADDGAAYERFLGRWSRLLAGPFVDFAKPREEGGVLDIGCGTGSVALVLAERGWRGRTTGIVERSFTAALAQLSLNFVGDAAKAVSEMRRVVFPGGVVAAAAWVVRGIVP